MTWNFHGLEPQRWISIDRTFYRSKLTLFVSSFPDRCASSIDESKRIWCSFFQTTNDSGILSFHLPIKSIFSGKITNFVINSLAVWWIFLGRWIQISGSTVMSKFFQNFGIFLTLGVILTRNNVVNPPYSIDILEDILALHSSIFFCFYLF